MSPKPKHHFLIIIIYNKERDARIKILQSKATEHRKDSEIKNGNFFGVVRDAGSNFSQILSGGVR